MKRYTFASFEEFEKSTACGQAEAVTAIFENGWIKCDVMTECKTWKTAVNRFFKALDDIKALDGWKDCIVESCENGYFKDDDSRMADYSRNPFTSFYWGVEALDDNLYYVFINVRA